MDEDIIARRIRLPQEGELLAYVEEELGSARMRVICEDGVIRLARVPGGKKRYLWVKRGSYVLVKLWEVRKDRCDIIYKYSDTEVEWLRKYGYLDKLEKQLKEII